MLDHRSTNKRATCTRNISYKSGIWTTGTVNFHVFPVGLHQRLHSCSTLWFPMNAFALLRTRVRVRGFHSGFCIDLFCKLLIRFRVMNAVLFCRTQSTPLSSKKIGNSTQSTISLYCRRCLEFCWLPRQGTLSPKGERTCCATTWPVSVWFLTPCRQRRHHASSHYKAFRICYQDVMRKVELLNLLPRNDRTQVREKRSIPIAYEHFCVWEIQLTS